MDFAADPWFERTSYYWSDSPSVYGPLFTGASTAVMEVAGTSVGLARAGFAGLTLAGFALAIGLLGRRIGWSKSAVLLGLNPLILTFGINDLHCDVLVGAFVLAAVLALERSKAILAGVAIALAVAVKISAVPALAGAGIWLLVKRRWGAAAGLTAGFVVVIASGIALVGGLDALAPITDATGRQTRFSIWNPVADLLASWWGSAPPTLGTADKVVGTASSIVVAGVGLGLIWRYRCEPVPALAVVAGLVTYQVLGAYALSWYALWSLPALALVFHTRLALLCLAHGCWIAVAYLSGWVSLLVLAAGAAAWGVYYRSRRLTPAPS